MSWTLGLEDFVSLPQGKQILQRSLGITLEKEIYKKKQKQKTKVVRIQSLPTVVSERGLTSGFPRTAPMYTYHLGLIIHSTPLYSQVFWFGG